jgi:hypothetical protein
MSNVLRRLKRLETQMTDRSGVVPHSEAWFQYWSERHDELLSGDAHAVSRIPLAYLDDLLARVDRGAVQRAIAARYEAERAGGRTPNDIWPYRSNSKKGNGLTAHALNVDQHEGFARFWRETPCA